MPSALDKAIAATLEGLMVEGGPLETETVEDRGVTLPVFKRAPANLPQYFAYFCAQHGDKPFLVDGDIRLSFAETYAAARAAAGGLVEGHGLKPGERVGIAARNSSNWITAYMAILMAGGVATLLNGWWQGGELGESVAQVGCRFVLADAARAARLEEHGGDHGATVLPMTHDCLPAEGLASLTAKGGGAETPLPDPAPLDNATILFTSGSTGRSKGAFSNHRAVVQGTMSYVGQTLIFFELLKAGGQDVGALQPATLLNVPLFHVTAEVPVMLQSFAIGRKLVLMPRWDAEDAMRLIEKEKITYFVGVPLMSYEIVTHPKRHEYDLTTCTGFAAGGAPRPVEHVKKIKQEFDWGFPLMGYGLTETNGVGCGNFTENYIAKPDSTGPASKPLVEVDVVDDAGKRLPQGERGEVGIRTIANFTGYWGDEDATAAAFTGERFFLTGDIGYLDEDGYLYIVDRKKDIIIRGGENISSPEVEAAAHEHPGVAEVSVFGIADDHYGEVPGMVYHAREGRDVEPEELLEYMRERLAPFKLPAHIWKSEEALPRLGTQKIDKNSLRALYNARVSEAA